MVQSKRESMKRLENAVSDGKVDRQMMPVIGRLNELADYHTTSSCAGRINLFEIKSFGEKGTLNILGKWHEPVGPKAFLAAARAHKANELWLKAEPPILHVVCSNFDSARRLLTAAYSAGFKSSSIKSGGKSFMVEITSTEHLELPLGKGGRLMVDRKYLDFLLRTANSKLRRSQEKLERLKKELAGFTQKRQAPTEEQISKALEKIRKHMVIVPCEPGQKKKECRQLTKKLQKSKKK
ncbi:MAG: hypothetical protein ABH829_00470 [archaeon]